ncbi:6501_t:CDS:2 [Funneliformis geosporum]|uniref:CXXC-type zinc finger protein 1 n=1 Tax=Funneliformis geosporum TaxID=1117311 RepID=A0A9W4SN22_9GLOM|nr:6501_t:CDS:2 [Funneliformis geosporum]CAI2175412.1 9396_t:CDS:2 [Funneliformis geosporum]
MSPVVELLLETSQEPTSQVKNLSASEYKQESKEEMQQVPQKQTTSSFNIMSMLNPAPSPSYRSSYTNASTVGSSVQQETHTHSVLPPALSITQQPFYGSENLPPQSPQTPNIPSNLNTLRLPPPYPINPTFQSVSPPSTFSTSACSPIGFSYNYSIHKQNFPTVGFNNVTNVTPLSQTNTSSLNSISVTTTPTTSHSLLNNLSLSNTPSTNYNTSITINHSTSSAKCVETEETPVTVNKKNHHSLQSNNKSNNTSTANGVSSIPKTSIPSGEPNGMRIKNQSNSIVEYASSSVQVEYDEYGPPCPTNPKHGTMEVDDDEEETHFVSGLDQLASTALNELQNMRRKEMESSEAGSGEENLPSQEEQGSLPASPFVERSFTPIKTFLSPPSYESTTGSTPAPPQTDSEFPQYEFEETSGETTETDSDGSISREAATSNKAVSNHIVKKIKSKNYLTKVKGKEKKDRQTKSRKYKIKREDPETVSSDDDKPRKRKPSIKRPRIPPLKRKATSQSVHNNSKNKRLKKSSSSPHFRSRTTSNNSSVNNSPRLQPQVEMTTVDDMVIEVGKKVQHYCICRSTDGESFMIECDNCDEWFHGDCVNISREESQMVDKYYCPNCTDLGHKTSWKPEKCKYPPCKKPARFVKTKFCSIKCGLSWNRELLKKEERLAKMGKLLKQKVKDNKDRKGRVKRNVTNRAGHLEDSEHLKKISRRKDSIKKELEIIDKRNKITVKDSEKSQSDSEPDDSNRSSQDVPCEFDKQSESDVNIRNGQICGYNPRLDWVDNDVKEKVGAVEDVCSAPRGKCKKHGSWQKRRSTQIDLMKASKIERLEELSEKQKLIKARMKKRTDMLDAFTNQTIDHTTNRKNK